MSFNSLSLLTTSEIYDLLLTEMAKYIAEAIVIFVKKTFQTFVPTRPLPLGTLFIGPLEYVSKLKVGVVLGTGTFL